MPTPQLDKTLSDRQDCIHSWIQDAPIKVCYLCGYKPPTLSKEAEKITKLVDEIMNRYGKQSYPHPVYGAVYLNDFSVWYNIKETLIKTFTKEAEIVQSAIEAERNRTNDILQIVKGVTRYVEYPIEQYEYDQLAGKVVVGSNENPIEMLSKRDVEVFNATSKMIWGKVEKNIEALAEKEL